MSDLLGGWTLATLHAFARAVQGCPRLHAALCCEYGRPMACKRALIVLAVFLAQSAMAEPTPNLLPKTSDIAKRFRMADRNNDGALSRAEANQAGWLVERLDRFEI